MRRELMTPLYCTTEHDEGKRLAVAIAAPHKDPWPVCESCLKWVLDPRNGFEVQEMLLPPARHEQPSLLDEVLS